MSIESLKETMNQLTEKANELNSQIKEIRSVMVDNLNREVETNDSKESLEAYKCYKEASKKKGELESNLYYIMLSRVDNIGAIYNIDSKDPDILAVVKELNYYYDPVYHRAPEIRSFCCRPQPTPEMRRELRDMTEIHSDKPIQINEELEQTLCSTIDQYKLPDGRSLNIVDYLLEIEKSYEG